MRAFPSLLIGGLTVFFLTNSALQADDKVIVHEWGTFTCLQDESGQAIGGINVDDEPVPNFVWGAYSVRQLVEKTPVYGGFGLPPYANFSKGWVPEDSDVTMRLETPVLYFYPPKGAEAQSVPPFDVHVEFHGGLLTQYYPYAQGNGFPSSFPRDQHLHIGAFTTGLTWRGVRIGSTEKPIETDDKVWTTPREVSSSLLEVKAPVYEMIDKSWQQKIETQAEHFLFYRGIGHLDSPLIVAPNGSGKKGAMEMYSPYMKGNGIENISSAWIVDIRSDGSCATRHVEDHIVVTETKTHTTFVIKDLHAWSAVSGFNVFPNFSAAFADSDFTADNLTKLKASMHDALVKEGLYPDEATAMLRTWELSYFKSPGLRFFYIVPRAWVDKVLPLQVAGAPTEITRVMIGRIELISDAQKATLARLAVGPCPNLMAIKEAAEDALEKSKLSEDEKQSFYGGERPLSDLGVTIPTWVQDYLSLGRFRDALIVHEQQQHPSAALAQFIKDNGLASEN